MFQYHCLNPIAEKGLGLFDEEYKKSEDLQECDAVLVRSAKMHDMELPESVKVIARAGAGVNNIPVKECAEKGVVVRTFEAAAFLRRSGADVTRVRKMLRDNLESYQARAEAVRTAHIYRDCFAIARCPSEGLDSPTVVGAQAANELLNIAGVKASFVLTEYNNEVYISARAIDEVNVQVMMEKMGGGGHMNIAGAQVKATPDEVEKMLKDIIDEDYQEEKAK